MFELSPCVCYDLGFPHSLQNFPVFWVPQLQTQDSLTGRGLPHSLQNLP